MAEQWISLTQTPEWRTLSMRFPDTIRQLSTAAAAGGDGAAGQAHVAWVGAEGRVHGDDGHAAEA